MKKGITALMLMASAQVMAAPAVWSSSWQQGMTHYVLADSSRAQLYFGCSPQGNTYVEYTAPDGRRISSQDSGHDIEASVDGGQPFLVSDTFSDAGSGQFEAFWPRLRRAKTLTVTSAGLPAVTFTLAPHQRVLPVFEQSGCLTRQ